MFAFDEIIPRRDTYSFKWDSATNDQVLPMWVADMDFRTAQSIIETLEKRVQHGIFGYTKVPQVYFDAVTGWFERRFGFTFEKKWTLHTTGVLAALSAIIKALTIPGDKVIVQTPVYNCFFSCIQNNNCEVAINKLVYSNGTYTIDFTDLEKKVSDERTKLLLLCSPHNPVGRVWKKDELVRIGKICRENNVIVVSDEIHCDIVFQEHKHIPFASISDDFLQHSITCTSPSKSFNLAGLQVANIHVANETIRNKIKKCLDINEVSLINPFAIDALIAAYNEGEVWLDELKKYLFDNYLYLKDYFEKHLPGLYVLPLEATYLVWVDCGVLKMSSTKITEILFEKENLWINPGIMYGEGGETFIRINIACPGKLLVEGLGKIKGRFVNILSG